ncbi:MAG: response regulator [Terriglobia bacterium]
MKILLVDDEADICRLVKTMVEPLGVEVRTCSDSREAASILETEKFDGIMLDVAMPNLDGIELTRKIRTTPLNQQAPIIMITGMDDVDTMRRAFEAGATFFIGKPFSREKVYAIFRSARGAMLAERRRGARVPHRTAVTCVRDEERFTATSTSIAEGGMGLESSGAAVVDGVLTLEFTMPDVKRPIKVTGRVRVKEVSGRTSIEFIDPMESGRDLIREYIYSKVIE